MPDVVTGTVSELSRRIGQIIAFDRGCFYLAPSFGVNLWTLECEIWSQKPKSCVVYNIHVFRYIEPFRHRWPLLQTDGQTCGETHAKIVLNVPVYGTTMSGDTALWICE